MAENKRVEYICSWCGLKSIKVASLGRPQPGYCPRRGKTKDGKMKPHAWVVNRKF